VEVAGTGWRMGKLDDLLLYAGSHRKVTALVGARPPPAAAGASRFRRHHHLAVGAARSGRRRRRGSPPTAELALHALLVVLGHVASLEWWPPGRAISASADGAAHVHAPAEPTAPPPVVAWRPRRRASPSGRRQAQAAAPAEGAKREETRRRSRGRPSAAPKRRRRPDEDVSRGAGARPRRAPAAASAPPRGQRAGQRRQRARHRDGRAGPLAHRHAPDLRGHGRVPRPRLRRRAGPVAARGQPLPGAAGRHDPHRRADHADPHQPGRGHPRGPDPARLRGAAQRRQAPRDAARRPGGGDGKGAPCRGHRACRTRPASSSS
jgi:hypothetical protein